jgi:hypothetical protein
MIRADTAPSRRSGAGRTSGVGASCVTLRGWQTLSAT